MYVFERLLALERRHSQGFLRMNLPQAIYLEGGKLDPSWEDPAMDGMTGTITFDRAIDYYNNCASTYDEYHARHFYRGPKFTAEYFAKTFEGRPDVRILDVASGTGLLGEELFKHGFREIDAMDPTPAMKAEAVAKNVYKKYFLEAITETPSDIPNDTYDCVLMCGGVAGDMFPCRGLLEIIRITKPGGMFINTTSKCHFDDAAKIGYRLEPYMKELEEKGKWRLVDTQVISDYHTTFCPHGIMHVFEILESGVTDFKSYVL